MGTVLNQLKSLIGQIDDSRCCPAPKGQTVLNQLKSVIGQIEGSGCCSAPCCSPVPCCGPPCGVNPCINPPCPFPYPQVCMTCPPPCLAPTAPKYVKPLALPCPPCPKGSGERDPEKEFKTRIANFYNNYNIDYHSTGSCNRGSKHHKHSSGCGQTVDGKSPKCEDYMKRKKDDCESQGCPTGFKPCQMKLCGPPNCSPLGIWKATIQPCPPKPRKRVSNKYVPGECTRPCCKHWKSKDGPCLYDKPCKAHCFDHPPGIKPSQKC